MCSVFSIATSNGWNLSGIEAAVERLKKISVWRFNDKFTDAFYPVASFLKLLKAYNFGQLRFFFCVCANRGVVLTSLSAMENISSSNRQIWCGRFASFLRRSPFIAALSDMLMLSIRLGNGTELSADNAARRHMDFFLVLWKVCCRLYRSSRGSHNLLCSRLYWQSPLGSA